MRRIPADNCSSRKRDGGVKDKLADASKSFTEPSVGEGDRANPIHGRFCLSTCILFAADTACNCLLPPDPLPRPALSVHSPVEQPVVKSKVESESSNIVSSLILFALFLTDICLTQAALALSQILIPINNKSNNCADVFVHTNFCFLSCSKTRYPHTHPAILSNDLV